ncbi:hypothetical protein MAR_012834 [Mya arenaria]|uniref:Chitin-binding type-2 domain-containing protein n=1 Tax=Mya arenaria TaxID=6604 RepID=A0ABY7FY54_MYAAR|nr:hypothetical protein MAR_012834 [Mya arenaria]
MIGYTTALFALVAGTLVIAGHDELVQCTPGVYQIIGKADCTGFFMCVFGKKVEMPPCPASSVFSSSANVCVPKGSMYDDCKKTTEGGGGHMPVLPDLGSLSPKERCKMFGGVFPHPTECQVFYNCSVSYTHAFFEQHLVECPYPQLFNTDTKQCDHFENVKCGSRTEFKDGYKLTANTDPTSVPFPTVDPAVSTSQARCSMAQRAAAFRKRKHADPAEEMTIAEKTTFTLIEIKMMKMGEVSNLQDIIGKADCTGFFLCVFGKPIEMPPCPPGSVFSSSVNVCVPKGSVYDDCKQPTEKSRIHMPVLPDLGPLSPEERCNMFGGVFPHPKECQAFYNCSVRYTPQIPRFFEQHLVECPYPQLFNTETKECDYFENVKCGSRTEFKNGCKLAYQTSI